MLKFNSLILILVLLISPYQTSVAKEVQIKHAGLTLNGYLEIAEGKTLKDGVILMTHGTIAHGRMEIQATLQGLLKESGINTLAVSWGLGLDNRKGMYDCATPHNHKHTDALNEIAAWTQWLKKQGTSKISLLGHSRGGNQIAWYAAERDDPLITSLIMLASTVFTPEGQAASYKKTYKKSLPKILSAAQAMVKAGKGDAWMEHTDFLYCKDTKVTAASFVDYYQPDERFNTITLMPRVKQPILAFIGTEDKVVPGFKKQVPAVAAKYPHITLKVIDGAGHFYRDLYAEEVVESIVDFISK